MPRRAKQEFRILGPYDRGGSYVLVILSPGGKRHDRRFATKGEAQDTKRDLEEEWAAKHTIQVEKALELYEAHLKQKGNALSTITTTLFRLRSLFTDKKGLVSKLTLMQCARLYQELAGRVAVDTHRNTLGQARTFGRWLVREKYLEVNPFAEVEGVGERSRGKTQLRVSEARAWLTTARRMMDEGEAGAVAAATALLLGLRASEVVKRRVRDLDDEGRMLWVEKTKTRRDRHLVVPELLRPYLLRLVEGKLPEAPLWPCQGRGWVRAWTERICARAKVQRITAQGLRGLHSTLAVAAGATSHLVAASLGHSEEVNQRHYTQGAVLEAARQERVLQVLEGGRK